MTTIFIDDNAAEIGEHEVRARLMEGAIIAGVPDDVAEALLTGAIAGDLGDRVLLGELTGCQCIDADHDTFVSLSPADRVELVVCEMTRRRDALKADD